MKSPYNGWITGIPFYSPVLLMGIFHSVSSVYVNRAPYPGTTIIAKV